MPAIKKYWVVDITSGFETVFRKWLPGNLHTREVTAILQRLAVRDLSLSEVIAASTRRPNRTTLLDVRIDEPPRGKRTIIWLPALPDYKASYYSEDELADYPEIVPEE